MKIHREVKQLLHRELTKKESRTIEFEPRHKHDFVSMTVNGKTIKYTIPRNPSDSRWTLNFRAEMRRMIKEARQCQD